MGKMMQCLKGNRSIIPFRPQLAGHVVRLDQSYIPVGILFLQPFQHRGRQIDSCDGNPRVPGPYCLQLQSGSASQIQKCLRLFRHELRHL